MRECQQCLSAQLQGLARFPDQPISNRFLKHSTDKEALFSIDLVQCLSCGLIQLEHMIPYGELKPRVDWITYTEPEDHLDHLADLLEKLPGISKESQIYGITFKDDSLLDRLRGKGFSRVYRIRPDEDFGIKETGVGVETLQHFITPSEVKKVVTHQGTANMVVVRHILEHAHDYREFCEGLKAFLTAENVGYLILEIPDCSKAIKSGDATMVWEEHSLYFSLPSFKRSLEMMGLSIHHLQVYPYALEDSLVAICTTSAGNQMTETDSGLIAEEITLGKAYAAQVEKMKTFWVSFLEAVQKSGKKLAIFGAGHFSCGFLNYYGLAKYFEFVVDDNPHKKGFFMPGSRLPIVGSKSLYESGIGLCVMGLSPTSEPKVVKNHGKLIEQGGKFVSMLPDSPFFPH